MEQLFDKYKNVQLFSKYRKYELIDEEFLTFDQFKTKIQSLGYILHKFKSQKSEIDLFFFKNDSKYISSTIHFKKILDRYSKPSNIIMITKEELNVYRKKSVKQYKNINLKNYLHRHFIMEMNKGPLCSKHSILTIEEARAVCYDLMCHAHKLPAIFQDDVQNIWIGGEINDIIKIESISEITGKTIHYRIVTPTSGKILQTGSLVKEEDTKEEEVPNTEIKKIEEVNEEVNEDNDDEDYVDDYED